MRNKVRGGVLREDDITLILRNIRIDAELSGTADIKLILKEDGSMADEGNHYRVEIIANLFGVSVRRVQQLTQEGIITTVKTKEGKRYELAPTIQRYIKYLSDKAYGKNKSEREMELKQQKLEAEIALKESQGELHKLKTDIAAGRYISIEEVTIDYSRFFVNFKKFALSIPNRLTGKLLSRLEPMEVRTLNKELSVETKRLLESFVVAGLTSDELEKKRNGKKSVPKV